MKTDPRRSEFREDSIIVYESLQSYTCFRHTNMFLVSHSDQVARYSNRENDRHRMEKKKRSQSHECFMGHNGLLIFPSHTLASTDTQDQGLSWHLCPIDTQQHMVCNSDTSRALAAAECGQSYELWI